MLPSLSPLSFIDLFSGAGGLSEGFRQAGFAARAGADLDPDAMATYALNFPGAMAVTGDLRVPSVRDRLLEAAAGVDVVCGGPPCQAFSQVRNHVRIIDDPRNSLYREFVDIVGRLSPTAFVMENVPGLDQMGVKEQVADDLSLAGEYEVVPQLVDAADFGTPQTRQRLLFIGFKKDSGFGVPRLTGTNATATYTLEREAINGAARYSVVTRAVLASRISVSALADANDERVVSVEQAIGDLTHLAVGNRDDSLSQAELPPPTSAYQRRMRENCEQISNVQVPRLNRDTALRLAAIPEGGNYRDLPADLQARYLTGERWGPHNGTGMLGRKHYYAYRRLHSGIWAWTLNTKADAAYHYRIPRALSVREFARLQGFPDRFVFTTDPRRGALPGRIDGGAAHSRYRQVGNAVPPTLAARVAVAIRDEILARRATAEAS